jgi:hypothetical protein
MQSRGVPVLARIVRVVILALPIFLILALTILLVACVSAYFGETPVLSADNMYVGTVCGLIAWLIFAVFHIKKETLVLPPADRPTFMDDLKAQLAGLGYAVVSETKLRLVSKPSFHSMLFGGGIRADVEQDGIRIVGPRVYLEMLRKRLRMESHIEKVQRSFLEAKRREGENLLRRVQISMRVTGKQWHAVYNKVVTLLARDDAEVICEVNVLAQSDLGIRDSMVELGVREWLRHEGIQAEIHKEPLQGPEPSREPAADGESDNQKEVSSSSPSTTAN